MLKPYAAVEQNSLGRIHMEPAPGERGEFQRDRDRVIHSVAFRRLEYKTQVFVNHEGDHYRTRLTHSLEVAQISRTVARSLGLNEDLAEAIALAHDLGHTPFGHAGQDALNHCMKNHGGFEHNLQSLRVVDKLEKRYAAFCGLNLTFEAREGILKHCSRANVAKLGAVGTRFLNSTQPSLEAQLVDICDSLAYNNHDVDDGLRSGILTLDILFAHDMFKDVFKFVRRKYPGARDKVVIYETVRKMIDLQVRDLIKTSQEKITDRYPKTIADIRNHPEFLISFSPEIKREMRALRTILFANLYLDDRVKNMVEQGKEIITGLFEHFIAVKENSAREVADYIAGMTDRYAEKLYADIQP